MSRAQALHTSSRPREAIACQSLSLIHHHPPFPTSAGGESRAEKPSCCTLVRECWILPVAAMNPVWAIGMYLFLAGGTTVVFLWLSSRLARRRAGHSLHQTYHAQDPTQPPQRGVRLSQVYPKEGETDTDIDIILKIDSQSFNNLYGEWLRRSFSDHLTWYVEGTNVSIIMPEGSRKVPFDELKSRVQEAQTSLRVPLRVQA
jgi:hypothetical protein